MTQTTQLYINGNYVPSSSGETFEVLNPFSGQVVGKAASASSADGKAAVDAAAKAFKTWEYSSHNDRRDVLLRAANLLESEKYRNKIVQCMAEEVAAPLYWSMFNVMGSANLLRTQAGVVERLKGEIFPSGTVPGAQVISQRRAMGVIFCIAPWNAPITLTVRAIASPLIAGNTLVLKPSESSPKSQSIIVELFEEAGLPAGVLNFLPMSREGAPALTAEIIGNLLVRNVNFTGSDRVGKIIAMEAAKHLKPCILELGGKAPAVVLNDANITEAAKGLVFGALANSGQICMSTERVIVQSGIAEQLISQVKGLCESIKAGDTTTDRTSQIGALFTESLAENVVGMIKEAQASGAEVILGDTNRKRSVLVPHLIRNVKPGMRVWDRESFGPVMVFAVVDTVDEAVDMANSSEYSLCASLWTSDVFAGQAIAFRIRAGCTSINGPTLHSEPADGLVGLGGASGYGRFHIENFTDRRSIIVHPPGRKYPPPFFT
ncbi:aldehyde dehydrogenase [Pholiota conissans]|uniref:Aldehyde dehydrogenase n=1 Tax=Pholiota conissans TaxID=109636 RepID=A0A9P6CY00_9AGAR|nr:aldehyde dehydrogenase [Pholiota conissans]